MDFFDVIFPLNISPLTYKYSGDISENLLPGTLVSVPFKNKIAKGIIFGRSTKIHPGTIKDIHEIHGNEPLVSSSMIHLLKWMSEYYLAEPGLILKNMLPKEAFKPVRRKKQKGQNEPHFRKKYFDNFTKKIIEIDINKTQIIRETLESKSYMSFLLHAPSFAYEYSFLLKILPHVRNAIILAPELSLVLNLYELFRGKFGDRVCIYHSDLSKGEKSEAIQKIISGNSDLVLGTRSAIFAPLKTVSLISVMQEQGTPYKQENLPCYNARDVAVMRGYLDKAVVLLSSICPSIESLYNCKIGKYTIIKPQHSPERPRIKIIDMRFEKKTKPYLSKPVIDTAIKHIKNEKKIMFVINRRGHSTMLQCMDCNYIEECPACRIPLVYHKQDMSMKCHYCAHKISEVPERCSRCKGYNLQLFGAGTQRIQEDLEKIIGIKAIRFDTDMAKKKSEIQSIIGNIFSNDIRIIIGTKLMTKRLETTPDYSLAVIINPDILLNLPDFRSVEKTYQEISAAIDKINPDGEVLIQTKMPQNYLYKSLKNYDNTFFLKEELPKRKALNYPPYSRLLLLKFVCSRDISGKLSQILHTSDDVEIIGPYKSKNKQGNNEFKLLLKSSVRGKLQKAAKSLIQEFRDSKGLRIKVDVDPIIF